MEAAAPVPVPSSHRSYTLTMLETLSASRMAESIEGDAPPDTSVPRLTCTPSSMSLRTLSIPLRSIELLMGQWATVAPRARSNSPACNLNLPLKI